MFNDYASLVDTIAKYLGYDADGMIPVFIGLAEQRIQRDANLRVMERRGTKSTSPGVDFVWLPDKRIPGDWDVYLNMREVSLAASKPVNLAYITPDEYTDRAGSSGMPRAYSIIGRSLVFAPVPDAAYTVLLTYYARIPPLSDAQPTNDVLLAYPDLYLYASLVESVPYARSSVPGELWASMYAAAIRDARHGDDKARYSRQISAKPPRRFS